MIKTFFTVTCLLFLFSGCFSASSLNPFSDDTKEATLPIPKDAPKWVHNSKERNYISVVSFSTIKNSEVTEFDKKRVLLHAGNTLSQKIYLKTKKFYKEYEKNLDNPKVFEKDVQNIAKQISLKSLSKSKIKDSWLSKDNRLFVRIVVESDFVANEIQTESKNIYKTNEILYKNVLSNRAKASLIQDLEK